MTRKTILVVDDQAHNRAFIRAVLEREGCRVLEAGNEAAAWQAVQQASTPVSLALIDAELPGIAGSDGSDILQAVQGVPVLFMSADERNTPGAAGKVAASGNTLSKPFTVTGLIAAVESRLARPRRDTTSKN